MKAKILLIVSILFLLSGCQTIKEKSDKIVKKENITKDKFEFQMLYGVNTPLQKKIIESGWNLRIYIPFGKSWYPYFMRRLAERPANLMFFIRAIFGR